LSVEIVAGVPTQLTASFALAECNGDTTYGEDEA